MKTPVQRLVGGCRGMVLRVILSLPAGRVWAADSTVGNQPPVQMQKYVVSDRHLLCFGLALELWEDKNSGQVMAMYVKAVAPGSMAEQEGIAPGTRIYTIEGVAVDNFPATFAAGSPLNQLFIDRQNGDRVTLEVKFLGKYGTKFITLVQNPGLQVTISRNHPKAP